MFLRSRRLFKTKRSSFPWFIREGARPTFEKRSSLEKHCTDNAKVVGSNPVQSLKFLQVIFFQQCYSCILICHHVYLIATVQSIYYHGIYILEPSITSTEHRGPNPHTTALMWLRYLSWQRRCTRSEPEIVSVQPFSSAMAAFAFIMMSAGQGVCSPVITFSLTFAARGKSLLGISL